MRDCVRIDYTVTLLHLLLAILNLRTFTLRVEMATAYIDQSIAYLSQYVLFIHGSFLRRLGHHGYHCVPPAPPHTTLSRPQNQAKGTPASLYVQL